MKLVKILIWTCMFIFSLIGGYLPVLLGSSWLSYASVFGNAIGGAIGIYIGYKLGNHWGL